jgi:KaiC/GvpD/RAD55 family RecA-like ATPase
MNYFTHYANAGFSVIPIKTDGTKAPAIGAWNQYRMAIAEATELERWHSEGRGVAIIGGHVSGGLEVIDIDDPSLVKPFIEALSNTDPTIVNRVAFVATPRQDPETGRTGCHILYRCEEPDGNQKLAMTEPLPVIDENGEHKRNPITNDPMYKSETLIETRGEGGYVLTVGCPPNAHPSNREYEHKWGCEIADLTKISNADRRALHMAARAFDRSIVEVHNQHESERDEESPGNVYARRTSWQEILGPHGWEPVGSVNGVTRWRRPGKSIGWSATTGLVSQNGAELLCVFSSNAAPFEGATTGAKCSTHSKFDAYAKLNFHGDHSAAAKHLAANGFGKQQKPTAAKPITMTTWEQATASYLEEIAAGGQHVLDTGIEDLDIAVGGFGFGEVIIIGGAPSHGKTMLALQCADHFSTQGFSSLLLNEEMNFQMLAKRRLQMASPIDEMEWASRLDDLAEQHDEWSSRRSPVYLSPPCGTVEAAVAAMEWAHQNEIRIVVVDYAQLLRGAGQSRYEQVTDVSQRLREATSRYGLLTILLAQLNRASRKTGDRPRATDLRDSGQLEQDADVVLTIDRPFLRGDTEKPHDEFNVFVEKNRNRETKANEVRLKVDLRRQTIKERPIESYEWKP